MKKLGKVIIFCIIFLFLYNYTYQVLSWKDTAGEYTSSLKTLYEMEENTADVLFFGSSHCYCSIVNANLWKDYGIASVGVSISGQDTAGTYYTIKEALKTQKPKVLCIESFGTVFSGYIIKGNLYRNTLLYKPSVNAYEVVDNLVTDEEEKKDLLLRWPIIHTRYKELQKEDFQGNRVPYLGYLTGFKMNKVDPIRWTAGDEIVPMDEEIESWYRRIIDLAAEEGIRLCFFVSPYVETEENQKKYNHLEQLAKENGALFVNMIKDASSIGMNENVDFIDAYHTNYGGAQKVTAYMGEILKEKFDLPDRRGDSRYERWEEDLVAREHELMNGTLLATNDLKVYLDILSILGDYTVILATSGEYLSEEADFADWIHQLGIGEEFFEKSGIWIWDNKELTYSSQEKDSIYYTELSNGDLAVSSLSDDKSIIIDRNNYYKFDSSINVVVYDNILGKVVDAVGFYAPNHYGVVR